MNVTDAIKFQLLGWLAILEKNFRVSIQIGWIGLSDYCPFQIQLIMPAARIRTDFTCRICDDIRNTFFLRYMARKNNLKLCQ